MRSNRDFAPSLPISTIACWDVSRTPVSSELYFIGAFPHTLIEPRASREAVGSGDQLSEPGGYSLAQQMRDNPLCPRAYHYSDTTFDKSQQSSDRKFALNFELHQEPDYAQSSWSAHLVLQAPRA